MEAAKEEEALEDKMITDEVPKRWIETSWTVKNISPSSMLEEEQLRPENYLPFDSPVVLIGEVPLEDKLEIHVMINP